MPFLRTGAISFEKALARSAGSAITTSFLVDKLQSLPSAVGSWGAFAHAPCSVTFYLPPHELRSPDFGGWWEFRVGFVCLRACVCFGGVFFFFNLKKEEENEKEITHFLCKLSLPRYRTAQPQGRFPEVGRQLREPGKLSGAGWPLRTCALQGNAYPPPPGGHVGAPVVSLGWERHGTPLSLAPPQRPPCMRARA